MKLIKGIFLAIITMLIATGCGEVEHDSYYNIETDSFILNKGNQKIVFSINDDQKFSDGIKASDVTLINAYEGLKCTSVKKLDDKSVEVTIEGECKESEDFGEIIFVNGTNDFKYYQRVVTPILMGVSTGGSSFGNKYSYRTVYKLPEGYEFTDDAVNYLNFDKNIGDWEITFGGDEVTVTVTNLDKSVGYPVIEFLEGSNTLGVKFSVRVGIV